MKKKKIYITIIIIFLIVLLAIGIIAIIKNKNGNSDNTDDIIIERIPVEENIIPEDLVTIESSEDNVIEKDGIEASVVDVKNYGNNLLVTTSLKNNTGKKIEGFYIEIELLDKDGKVLSITAEESNKTIEPNGVCKLEHNIAGIKNREDIANARIRTFKQ